MAQGNFATDRGNGGEPHQHVPNKGPHGSAEAHLTTNQGIRVSDNQNSLKSGGRGPTLLEDFVLREKIFHFDHERIPERIVHARGSAAHGYFEATDDISDLSKAALFRKGEKTPVFTRFSTVAGGAGPSRRNAPCGCRPGRGVRVIGKTKNCGRRIALVTADAAVAPRC